MYGGMFTDRPFEFNLKCIVISLFLGVAYWLSPKKNMIVLMIILIGSYIAISWYDYVYDCNPRMESGYLNPRTIFKNIPTATHSGSYPGNSEEAAYLRLVYLFHLFIAAPLMLYTGKVGHEQFKDDSVKSLAFSSLFSMGALAFMYHGYRVFYPRVPKSNPSELPYIYKYNNISPYTGSPTPAVPTLGRAHYIKHRGAV